jgi:hypothetical protein
MSGFFIFKCHISLMFMSFFHINNYHFYIECIYLKYRDSKHLYTKHFLTKIY